MIVSTSIQKNPDKVWADYFVDVNLHPHRRLSFSGWIKNIGPAVNTGGKAYFWNHEGSSYDSMYYVWKNMKVLKLIEVMYVIGIFTMDNPNGKSLWMKNNCL